MCFCYTRPVLFVLRLPSLFSVFSLEFVSKSLCFEAGKATKTSEDDVSDEAR